MPEQHVSDLTRFLDYIVGRFRAWDIPSAMDELGEYLLQLCLELPADFWNDRIKPACLGHELRHLLHEDPYTRRAFQKPRGWPGDAITLDFVLLGHPPPGTTRLGAEVFKCTTRSSNGLSMLARRDHVATLVDAIAREVPNPRVLSIGCGHLREA